MRRPAIFLDRDGTLVHAVHYPTRPDQLVVYDGVLAELAALRADGFGLVVITNQSGLARGYFDAEALAAMHDALGATLAAAGAPLDGVYHCPHHPEGSVAELAVACGCRKPEPGMLLRAAEELVLDLGRSWFVGDILDDVEAGSRAGCRTALVDLGTESPPPSAARTPDLVARDTASALRAIRALAVGRPSPEPAHVPAGWPPPTSPAVSPPQEAAHALA